MYKKRVMISLIGIVSIVLVIGLLYVLFESSTGEEGKQPSENHNSEEKAEESSGVRNDVKEVFLLSKTGKVPHSPFVVGKTKLKEIQEQWGEPSTIDETSIGNYMVYSDYDVTIGIKNQIARDIRSYHSDLTHIHFEDIKKVMGEPTEVTYYKDDHVNQIIFRYQVNDTFQLKWVLEKPTEQNPNPTVHHISVVTEIEEPVNENEGLTIDEKIGQMIFAGISGTKMNENMNQLITKYHVGGIILNGDNLVSPEQTVAYINQIKQVNEEDIPLFLGVDQEGGRISKLPGELIDFPTNLEIGNKNDPSLSYEIGTVLGKELKAFGFNVNFAPVLDVNSNPNNPVIGDRSFSSNPKIVSSLGMQTMKGLQSQSILSAVKRFPGHGDTNVDSHLELPQVDKTLAELEELEFLPFRQAVKEGADMVMVGHILVPSLDKTLPSSMSKTIITDILRHELGFNGVVITDDFFMKAITNEYDIGDAAVQSIMAGSDIIMVAHDYNKIVHVRNSIKKAVENGEISEKRLDESVDRILRLKDKYHLDHTKVKSVDIEMLNHSIQTVLDKYSLQN